MGPGQSHAWVPGEPVNEKGDPKVPRVDRKTRFRRVACLG